MSLAVNTNADTITHLETWFIRRGVPHFIEDYSATQDVFTRALPALSLVFVFEMFGALNFDWELWANVLALLAGLVALIGAWALVNRARGRRPLQLPDELGPVELATFVLVPALLPLVFGGQVVSAAVTAVGNLALLGIIYLFTSYGVLPMTRWAGVRLGRQLGSVVGLLARALPLLLLFGVFLFLTPEIWQVAESMQGPFFWAVVGLFFFLGTLFLVTRLPREVRELATYQSAEELRGHLIGTPAEELTIRSMPDPPALSWRQWGNLGLVLLFGEGLQVLLVTIMIGLFFVAFGLLVMTAELQMAWSGVRELDTLATIRLWGRDIPFTVELLRMSGFLAAFSGLYFSVTAVTDATYRKEFFEDVVAEVRQALAVRAAYLAVRPGSGQSS